MSCLFDARVGRCADVSYVRADVNDQGWVYVSDAVTVLLHLFADISIPCEKAADANDDGVLDVSDAISVLSYLFASAPPPPDPFPDCGVDTTGDWLSCEEFPPCPLPDPTISISAFNVEHPNTSQLS